MTLQERVDQLGHCTQESFAEIATAVGPLRVNRADVSRWTCGPGVRVRMAKQLERTLSELENLVAFYGVPIDLSDSAKVAKLLVGLRDIRSKVANAELPSAMNRHATFSPGGNVAKAFGTPTDGVVENALATETET